MLFPASENKAKFQADLKVERLAERLASDVLRCQNGEPMDGDETEKLASMFLIKLDDFNGNN